MTEEEINQQTLARVDERTKSIQSEIGQLRDDMKTTAAVLADKTREIAIAVAEKTKEADIRMNTHMAEVQSRLTIQSDNLKNEYVSKTEFWPIKIIVYGFVALMLTALCTAIVTTVLHQPQQAFQSEPIKPLR